MGDTFTAYGRILCLDCAGREVESKPRAGRKTDDGRMQRNIDPTVCAGCGFDNGDTGLETVSDIPFCGDCRCRMLRRPFPVWVKAFFFTVLVVCVCALVRNVRFLKGYVEMRRVLRAMQGADLETAARLGETAAAHVPESGELRAMADSYRALHLMAVQNNCSAALELLQRCEGVMGPDAVGPAKRAAEAGAAFDRKDYDKFLERQLECLKLAGDEPMAVAGVASAYACKYVETADEQFKEKALDYLEKARKLAPAGDAQFGEYEERILHRIEKREIISAQEYGKRFREEK